MSMKMTSTTMNTFENFLATTSSNLKQISLIVPKRKTKKIVNEKAKKQLKLIVSSMNGKLVVCNESIVLIETLNVDGTVQQHLYKYV